MRQAASLTGHLEAATPQLSDDDITSAINDLKDISESVENLSSMLSKVWSLDRSVDIEDGLVFALIDIELEEAHVREHLRHLVALLRRRGIWEIEEDLDLLVDDDDP